MDSRTRWVLPGIAVLVLLALVVSHGHERPDEPEPTPGSEEKVVRFPLPDPAPVEDPIERARGIYVLKSGDRTYTLDLQSGSRFTFLVARGGRPVRQGSGTWSLTGARLTLAYTAVSGLPAITPENPDVAVNVWRGRTIELRDTGAAQPVILVKRTALRER